MIYTFNINPSSETWNLAVADLISHYQWKNIAVIYCKRIETVQSLLGILSRADAEVLLLNANSTEVLFLITRMIKLREIREVVISCDSYQLLMNILKMVSFLLHSHYNLLTDFPYSTFGRPSSGNCRPLCKC